MSAAGPVRVVPLGGFLGAGKTTTMIRAAQELEARGEVVAVVTNDQGDDLVDTASATERTTAAVAEVTGGCFCCRFEDLAATIDDLVREVRPTVILAEAVGSCTDLQSTVVRPLRQLHGDVVDVAPLVILTDPDRFRSLRDQLGPGGTETTDLAHLYHHQLAEADVIALNKVDTLGDDDRDRLVAELSDRFSTRVVPFSAATGDGFGLLLDVWAGPAPQRSPVPFAVDYQRYGAAEAELAWTNQVFDVTGTAFVPDAWLDSFFERLEAELSGSLVGHVKVRVASAVGTARASLVSAAPGAMRDESSPDPVDRATVLVNARVGTTPQQLDEAIVASVSAAGARTTTTSRRERGEVFRPGFPVPRHRM